MFFMPILILPVVFKDICFLKPWPGGWKRWARLAQRAGMDEGVGAGPEEQGWTRAGPERTGWTEWEWLGPERTQLAREPGVGRQGWAAEPWAMSALRRVNNRDQSLCLGGAVPIPRGSALTFLNLMGGGGGQVGGQDQSPECWVGHWQSVVLHLEEEGELHKVLLVKLVPSGLIKKAQTKCLYG